MKIPGVYGRVSLVVDWIKHLTSEGISCRRPNKSPIFIETSDEKTTTRRTKEPGRKHNFDWNMIKYKYFFF